MVQWYAKVPAVAKVCVKVPPGAIEPLFQPVAFDVDVCATAPLFFQVTVVPTDTTMLVGENAKSTIDTFDACVGDVGERLLVQEMAQTRTAIAKSRPERK